MSQSLLVHVPPHKSISNYMNSHIDTSQCQCQEGISYKLVEIREYLKLPAHFLTHSLGENTYRQQIESILI